MRSGVEAFNEPLNFCDVNFPVPMRILKGLVIAQENEPPCL